MNDTRTLTTKQERFLEAYDGNATAAAIAAGYSPKTARKRGCMLLDQLSEFIRERENLRNSSAIAKREERQMFWTSLMRNEDIPLKDRLRASELLGKSEGDFIERHNISGEITPASLLEDLERRQNSITVEFISPSGEKIEEL